MNESYDPRSAEPAWQKRWEEDGLHSTELHTAKRPYYSIVMFPYPSGDKLHVGHWYNFAPADSYARFMRMKGFDVCQPMGFDAFGLPAENYAIKTGIHPARSIAENIETMTRQLQRIGCMYDWSKEVRTSKPEYYRWTQWLFLKMYKQGLVYRKDGNVNWCESCQTVLANEQVHEGACDRCSTIVIQKPLAQWYWKITAYAERLLAGLEDLDWPEKTKLMQTNWIGKSTGTEIDFRVEGDGSAITVYTTRPDTLFGVTYIVLAPEHPLLDRIVPEECAAKITAYREAAALRTQMERSDMTKEKTGVFSGAYVLHPITKERLPVWVADYALMQYGTGAVMAVPAHDERDYAFARKFEIPIKTVVQPADSGQSEEDCWTGDGVLVASGEFDGLAVSQAKQAITDWLEQNALGRRSVQYRLRDWLVSRQRYWGAPIPIVYDPQGNPHPIPEKYLPWLLPEDVEFRPTGTSPLSQSEELKERVESLFGEGWTPEVDTMDTFVCSSFYYLLYLSTPGVGLHAEALSDESSLIDTAIEQAWMPVDMYVGGPEHATMHLIYARFVMMALHDAGAVSHTEPFKRLVHQGLITHSGAKMSKSKGNVVSPDAFVEQYGSDVFRLYLMFMGPFTDGGDWSDSGINGLARFVKRVYALFRKNIEQGIDMEAEQKGKNTNTDCVQEVSDALLHSTIKRVTEDLERLHFNTAIAALMELLNAMERAEAVPRNVLEIFCLLLAPMAPHLCDELWMMLGNKPYVVQQQWPIFDPSKLTATSHTIVIQVNGKVRGELQVAADIGRDELLNLAKSHEKLQKYLADGVRKEIVILGKLVNFVV